MSSGSSGTITRLFDSLLESVGLASSFSSRLLPFVSVTAVSLVSDASSLEDLIPKKSMSSSIKLFSLLFMPKIEDDVEDLELELLGGASEYAVPCLPWQWEAHKTPAETPATQLRASDAE